MQLSPDEREILENIQEGIVDTHQLRIFTELSLDAILETLERLEDRQCITLKKKHDPVYDEPYWQAEITETGRKELSQRR